MNDLFTRLKAYILSTFGQSAPTTDDSNLLIDDLWAEFIAGISDENGNAVECFLSHEYFDGAAINALHTDNLITYCHDLPGGWLMQSDTERLSRFDLTSLRTLLILEQVWANAHPSWEPNV